MMQISTINRKRSWLADCITNGFTRFMILMIILALPLSTIQSQTRQASHSSSLMKGAKTINLINGLNITVEFNPEKETLWITGKTAKSDLFITEYIPLSNPMETGIETGKSYRLDNLYANIEYKILEIKDNRITRIWFRIAATSEKPPAEGWI
ncbi:MAG: hypothetical protein ABR519_10040 [Bacteroidales bacterium]